jgi:hypothetical protein
MTEGAHDATSCRWLGKYTSPWQCRACHRIQRKYRGACLGFNLLSLGEKVVHVLRRAGKLDRVTHHVLRRYNA